MTPAQQTILQTELATATYSGMSVAQILASINNPDINGYIDIACSDVSAYLSAAADATNGNEFASLLILANSSTANSVYIGLAKTAIWTLQNRQTIQTSVALNWQAFSALITNLGPSGANIFTTTTVNALLEMPAAMISRATQLGLPLVTAPDVWTALAANGSN